MIQISKLSKTLKNNNLVAWCKTDLFNYIATDRFVLKTSQEVKGSALSKLVDLLGNAPREEEGLKRYFGKVEFTTDEDFERYRDLLVQSREAEPIEFTNLVLQDKKFSLSIFKVPNNYVFVNKELVELVDLYDEDLPVGIFGSNPGAPVYFTDGVEEVAIAPVRAAIPPYLRGSENLKGNENG